MPKLDFRCKMVILKIKKLINNIKRVERSFPNNKKP